LARGGQRELHDAVGLSHAEAHRRALTLAAGGGHHGLSAQPFSQWEQERAAAGLGGQADRLLVFVGDRDLTAGHRLALAVTDHDEAPLAHICRVETDAVLTRQPTLELLVVGVVVPLAGPYAAGR